MRDFFVRPSGAAVPPSAHPDAETAVEDGGDPLDLAYPHHHFGVGLGTLRRRSFLYAM